MCMVLDAYHKADIDVRDAQIMERLFPILLLYIEDDIKYTGLEHLCQYKYVFLEIIVNTYLY